MTPKSKLFPISKRPWKASNFEIKRPLNSATLCYWLINLLLFYFYCRQCRWRMQRRQLLKSSKNVMEEKFTDTNIEVRSQFYECNLSLILLLLLDSDIVKKDQLIHTVQLFTELLWVYIHYTTIYRIVMGIYTYTVQICKMLTLLNFVY